MIKVVPSLTEISSIQKLLLHHGINEEDAKPMASLISGKLGNVGCKEVIRLCDQAEIIASETSITRLEALEDILEDVYIDKISASSICEIN